MNNLTRPLFVVFSLIVIGLPISLAQPRTTTPKKDVLTNSSIIELAQLGLGEAIIMEKIRQSECNFDTSLNGLKQLKAAKVSEAVISLMLNPKGTATPPMTSAPIPAGQPAATAQPTVADTATPREPGIYYLGPKGLVEINPTTFTGTKSNFLGTALTYGIKKSKMRASVRGATANTIIPTSRPVFYFSFDPSLASPGMAMSGLLSFGATSPGKFVLVKMERKNTSRETVLGEFNAYGTSSGTRDKDIQDFSFEKIKPGVFKVIPRTNLDVGEYCFYYAGTAGAMGLAGGKLFDFGVTTH